jgi:transposase InsO family protein
MGIHARACASTPTNGHLYTTTDSSTGPAGRGPDGRRRASWPHVHSASSSGALSRKWALDGITFTANGKPGKLLADTGANITAVTAKFAREAGLVIHPPDKGMGSVKTAGGDDFRTIGYVDLKIVVTLQLMNEDQNKRLPPQPVVWHRQIVLPRTWVVDFGDSGYDLYVAWAHWAFDPRDDVPATTPLGSLAKLLLSGATIYDGPRAPVAGAIPVPVVLMHPGPSRSTGKEAPQVSALSAAEEDELRARIRERIPVHKRNTKEAGQVVDLFVRYAKIFSPIDPDECTETIEFELINEPERVSFRAPLSRKVMESGGKAFDSLYEWIRKGFAEKVDWSTPSYGFVFVVPKPNGKFRVTINPKSVNESVKRVDPDGGFMPDSMIGEAIRLRNMQFVAQPDMAEAFLTLKLGPTAQRVSTFSTPLGKLRWKHGWFGFHSFPFHFQKLIMEKVVLPTIDDVPLAVILAWIDDIVLATAIFGDYLVALELVIIRILAFGGRLSLAKCNLLPDTIDWCGVEVDFLKNSWRIAEARVRDFKTIPVPQDRATLLHILGIIRYYYFGVRNQSAQRKRLAKLTELDQPGIRLADHWTDDHTSAMRGALEAITAGDWALLYDPKEPVYVTSDASGDHGFGITAHQYASDGTLRPIFFYSRGWLANQTVWSAQVKEAYAQWVAIAHFMPNTFKYARVVLIGDNKNLASGAKSADMRIRRWNEAIEAAGVTRVWTPGEFNSIADHASRVAKSDEHAVLPPDEAFETYLYSITAAKVPASPPSEEDPVFAPSVFAIVPQRRSPRLHPETAGATDPTPVGGDKKTKGKKTREARAAPPPGANAGSNAGAHAPLADDPSVVGHAGWVEEQTTQALDDIARLDTEAERLRATGVIVPGHLLITPRLRLIALAQLHASSAERSQWTVKPSHSTVLVGDFVLHLDSGRAIVPEAAKSIRLDLLRLAHDATNHYTGAERTLWTLREQARVVWKNIDKDVSEYVAACLRCALAKPPSHHKSNVGLLHPTLPPRVLHTWYADFKGPLPGGGYILAVREAITRFVRLRYLARITAAEFIPVFAEIITSLATAPAVLRTDNGAPFDSKEFEAFCSDNSIALTPGTAYHSQGQGKVENIFRSLTGAIVATLGHKAPDEWYRPPLLTKLEFVINTSVVDPLRGSPARNLFGVEPRTPLSASTNWEEVLGYAGRTFPPGAERVTDDDVNNILAAHHATLSAVHDLATQATCLAQALTKRKYDAHHEPSDFEAGQVVLRHTVPVNRLLPHFMGPYKITRVHRHDDNLAYLRWLPTDLGDKEFGPVHVSRLLHYKGPAERLNLIDAASFHVGTELEIVEKVLGHQTDADGNLLILVEWYNPDPSAKMPATYLPVEGLRKIRLVQEYCRKHGLDAEKKVGQRALRTAAERKPRHR